MKAEKTLQKATTIMLFECLILWSKKDIMKMETPKPKTMAMPSGIYGNI